MSEIWTIIGGGHGGQTFAGHMALLGKRVRLYTKSQEKADAINLKGGITLENAIEGFGQLEFATTDIEKALSNATHIVMILPSNWHDITTRQIAPFLQDGQAILILPEASCGAIAFRRTLEEVGCEKQVVIGAGCSLPYATRAIEPGHCHVSGAKSEVKIAALPAKDNTLLQTAFCDNFPVFKICKNVIETSLDNINAMMHPAPVLLSVARIEAIPEQTYEYYRDGITQSIGILLEAMDKERIAIAKAFGIEQRSLKQTYIDMYKCGDETMELWQLIRNNKGYAGIQNVKTLNSRYLMEDIPYSLVAILTLGEIVGIEAPCIKAICTLGYAIMGERMDLGRTSNALGLKGITKTDFIRYIEG